MAGSSKQFVYLPTYRPNTWLLWSKRGQTVYLREYTKNGCRIVRRLELHHAEALLAHMSSRVEKDACYNTISVDKVRLWFQLCSSLNIRDGLTAADEHDKLQALFKLQCLPYLGDANTAELKAVFSQWIAWFSNVKDKNEFINRYDHIDTNGLFKPGSGKSWQSPLLENARYKGKCQYINTDDELTDFSLAAIELTLAISAKENPFLPTVQSRIAPDGLAVRRNGFLTVLEVKGPKDEKDLLGPLLQATCGALAVAAKGDTPNAGFFCW